MAAEVQRQGDVNDAGAAITSTKQTTVTVAGQPIATDGDPVAPHGLPPHAAPTTANGCATVLIGGVPVNRSGDADTCGHVRAPNGTQVYICDATRVLAQAMGFPNNQVNLSQDEAEDIIAGRQAEEAAGVDPDTTEAVEYGDGGVATVSGGSANRYNNTSPVNNVSGPQPAPGSSDSDGTVDSPSDQPSNEDGQYIKWLPHVDSRVKPEVVQGLEGISQAVGYQLQVTSGYRSPEYNASVGGARRSQHMEGNATDIVQTGLTEQQRKDFIQAAIDNGFTAIGVYNTFTHIDIRGAKVAWGSNGSRTSLPNYPWAVEVLRANGYGV